MFCLTKFEEIFGCIDVVSYDQSYSIQICTNRDCLGTLFIDRILKILEIENPIDLYPPGPGTDLSRLHRAVNDTSGTDHHKFSIFYYVFLDIDKITNKDRYSKAFEQKFLLPKKYQILMKGLWLMDHQEFELALQFITHPSLIPSFSDEILEVLVENSNNDLNLPLIYYHTVQPTLNTKRAMDCLFSALARQSVTDAFYFSRTQNEFFQKYIFEMLVKIVIGDSSHDIKAHRCLELVNLPFTPQEDNWFCNYLLHGEGKLLDGAKDTYMMRLVGTGRFSEFLSVEDINTKSINELNWGILSNTVKSGLGPRSGP
ncbi:Protein ELYS [Golovinomyces cichoracearum]|uniref:Protein ELYS n=1 Tax=Golovinomyces cichoracearum TaxID=62708 RepID=A0A420J3I9_9PEZI|nr:Protein ELYS [Golovinomyces cichoracearum]